MNRIPSSIAPPLSRTHAEREQPTAAKHPFAKSCDPTRSAAPQHDDAARAMPISTAISRSRPAWRGNRSCRGRSHSLLSQDGGGRVLSRKAIAGSDAVLAERGAHTKGARSPETPRQRLGWAAERRPLRRPPRPLSPVGDCMSGEPGAGRSVGAAGSTRKQRRDRTSRSGGSTGRRTVSCVRPRTMPTPAGVSS
jgi:hypothetical protein